MIPANKIEELLQSLVRDSLSPKEEEKSRVTYRYDQLKSFLEGNDIFQVGSYARFTSVTPVHDLDIIWVIPPSLFQEKKISPQDLNLKDVLADLAKKLTKEYKDVREDVACLPQTHSVSIDFKDKESFSIDLVPAIESGEKNNFNESIYFVPEDEGEKLKWIKSDPKGYIKEATILNKTNVFRKATKYIKAWKYSYEDEETDFPLKSFHLEQIVKDILVKNPRHSIYSAILVFFNELETYISTPRIPDRANPNLMIDEYLEELSEKEQHQISDAHKLALERFISIPNSNSEQEAIAVMEEIISKDKTQVANINIANRITTAIASFFNPPSWQKELKWSSITNPSEFNISCRVNGQNKLSESVFFDNWELEFMALIPANVSYDEIWWQVVNTGNHAKSIGVSALRGGFFKGKNLSGKTLVDERKNFERTEYHGRHWIICYLIRNNQCIGISAPFYVRIFNRKYLTGNKGPRKRRKKRRR